jgi:putative two-component system response regulator
MTANSREVLKRTNILVVDDEEGTRALLRRVLLADKYDVNLAHDGSSALSAIASDPPDVVLLDVNMGNGLDGFEVCRRLRSDPATRLTPVIIITGLREREDRIKGIEAGADDFLTKPVDNHELLARVRSLARVKQYTDDLDSAASIIMALASMIEARDGYGEGHCHRMANYATRLGRAFGVDEADLQTLHRGGFLHDIGMLAIPDGVIRKEGPLNLEEYELVKSHTVVGDGLCSHLRSLQPVRTIVRHHHERLDGSGYPDGLSGNNLPLLAQIMGIVDVYEAVTTSAPYQNAQSVDQAITVLRNQVERGWRRKDLVEAFAWLVKNDDPPRLSEA